LIFTLGFQHEFPVVLMFTLGFQHEFPGKPRMNISTTGNSC
jgi:hypothetical protein